MIGRVCRGQKWAIEASRLFRGIRWIEIVQIGERPIARSLYANDLRREVIATRRIGVDIIPDESHRAVFGWTSGQVANLVQHAGRVVDVVGEKVIVGAVQVRVQRGAGVIKIYRDHTVTIVYDVVYLAFGQSTVRTNGEGVDIFVLVSHAKQPRSGYRHVIDVVLKRRSGNPRQSAVGSGRIGVDLACRAICGVGNVNVSDG